MTINKILMSAGLTLSTIAILGAPLFVGAEMINRQLELGDRGTDVSAMQTFFAADATIYPEGLVTGYFGVLTKAAVARFQTRNGIASVGRVGPVTLPVLNAQMSGVSHTDTSAPIVASVGVSTNSTGATVNWSTNTPARGKLYYSTSPLRSYNSFESTGADFVEVLFTGTLASYDNVERYSQSIQVNGLERNTMYFYQVVALDASNNVGLTIPAYFRTAQ